MLPRLNSGESEENRESRENRERHETRKLRLHTEFDLGRLLLDCRLLFFEEAIETKCTCGQKMDNTRGKCETYRSFSLSIKRLKHRGVHSLPMCGNLPFEGLINVKKSRLATNFRCR